MVLLFLRPLGAGKEGEDPLNSNDSCRDSIYIPTDLSHKEKGLFLELTWRQRQDQRS
jgi:hypothetical protein